MKIIRICLVAALLQLSNSSYAQDLWIPAGVSLGGSGTAQYNSTTGLLNIPFLLMRRPGQLSGEAVYGAVMQHTGNNEFKLLRTAALRQDDECTQAEVLAAIPQLSLSLSLEQAEALIGCKAVLNDRGTDLTTGRLVAAGWTGADGIANPGAAHLVSRVGNAGYITGGSGRPVIGSIGSGLSITSLNYTPPGVVFISATPAVMLIFREGTLEEYTYSVNDGYAACQLETLTANHALLTEGMSGDEVNLALGCGPDSRQGTVTVSEQREERRWTAERTTVTGQGDVSTSDVLVTATLVDGVLDSTSIMRGSMQSFRSSDCSVDTLTDGANRIREGLAESSLLDAVECEPGFISSSSVSETATKSYYQWRTENRDASPLESVNRSLSVTLTDGVVSDINFQRF